MPTDAKAEVYRRAQAQVLSLVEGMDDPVAAMASCCAVLYEALDYASWVGFYRVVAPGLLRVGPYQGPPGCLEIPFAQGVCGAAARSGETQLVEDVHRFAGHIACDPRARSEIVVPIADPEGRVLAVLDLDSHQPAAFDEADRQGLESLVLQLRPHLGA